MNHYVLLLRRESIDFTAYSPDQMQALLAEFDAWNAGMIGRRQLIASANLPVNKGATLRKGPIVADGPYAEAREAVTGLLLIAAEDETDARTLAAGCPFLSRGGSVELRPIAQLEFEDAAEALVEAHADARRAARAGEV
ncbi:MAG: YciI family protein [Vicinamibacterales bacterium]